MHTPGIFILPGVYIVNRIIRAFPSLFSKWAFPHATKSMRNICWASTIPSSNAGQYNDFNWNQGSRMFVLSRFVWNAKFSPVVFSCCWKFAPTARVYLRQLPMSLGLGVPHSHPPWPAVAATVRCLSPQLVSALWTVLCWFVILLITLEWPKTRSGGSR